MADQFDQILDECIDRINRGESLEACLAGYPEHAEQLEPLLRAVLQAKEAYPFVPSDSAKSEARQRFHTALEDLERRQEERQPLLPWLLGWSKVWVSAAAVIIIAVIGYFGIRPAILPVAPVPQPGPAPVIPLPQPSLEGNFVFLISDEVNAISDFESLKVTIAKVGLNLGDDSNSWVEFEPEVKEVDLTLLPGDKAQEIWRGDVPEGRYNKVFIQVSNVSGILKETGSPVEVKLPSGKLQISKPFEVTSGSVTNFVYDVTVVAAGSPQAGIKYILKPQVGQSGADQRFEKIDGKGGDRQHPERGSSLPNRGKKPRQ